MKKYKIELTEEQLAYLKQLVYIDETPTYLLDKTVECWNLLDKAEPIPEKIWTPFTTLKDGGTYLTRDGREVIVVKHPIADTELLNYPYRDSDNLRICWDKAGRYYGEGDDSPFDLILELQPFEEQTTE